MSVLCVANFPKHNIPICSQNLTIAWESSPAHTHQPTIGFLDIVINLDIFVAHNTFTDIKC